MLCIKIKINLNITIKSLSFFSLKFLPPTMDEGTHGSRW